MYEGVSREEEGRHRYLKLRRNQVRPDRRWNQPMTSSMEVGWDVWPVVNNYSVAKHAKKRMVQCEGGFYRKNGAFGRSAAEKEGLTAVV